MSQMDALLDEASKALDRWVALRLKAEEAAARHKHRTSAEATALAETVGKTGALAAAQGTDEWLQREIYAKQLAIKAIGLHEQYEQCIRRWETARSEFSAGKRVQ